MKEAQLVVLKKTEVEKGANLIVFLNFPCRPLTSPLQKT